MTQFNIPGAEINRDPVKKLINYKSIDCINFNNILTFPPPKNFQQKTPAPDRAPSKNLTPNICYLSKNKLYLQQLLTIKTKLL